ncbi:MULTISPECIES: ABC transporter ATP-binding protein [unclassified Frankia]|uniref:ATP-binding cassette domain-containing protein n=1 Tax=unclassified Frankia TaxID=2632575 RepID=UPI001EE3C126|nr:MULTISPECIES: ABC transporter ATP-binding protein [unclassified Frankia]
MVTPTRTAAGFRHARANVHRWWARSTAGVRHPARQVAAMAVLGLVSGVLELLTMVLMITLATGPARVGWRFAPLLGSSRGTLACAALLAAAGSAVTTVASARVTSRIGASALTSVRDRLARHYLAADWSAQRAEPTGRLQELALGDAAQISLGAERCGDAVAAALRLGAFAVAAIAVSPLATSALAVVVAAVLGSVRLAGRHTQAANRRAVDAASALGAALTETTTVAAELRVFGVVDEAADALAGASSRAGRLHGETMFRATVTPRLARDLAVLALVAVLLLVLWLDELPLATVGLVTLLVMRALGQASALGATTHQLRERLTQLDRVEEHLDRWAAGRAPGRRRCPAAGAIQLVGLEVTYPGTARPALTGVELTLRPGERLGVVGRSGAGKTTLAGLLLGLLEPTRGQVLVGPAGRAVDRAEIDPREWFSRVGVVPQQPTLITGTVAENIRFLRAGLGDAQVRAAAVRAGLGPELASWPDGLDHPSGLHGTAVSGGQRQRVALARALVRLPDLLVLDEPSSALDARAEEALRDAVATIGPATTVVVIAHRMSTVLGCDRVAVLEDGRLTALASPAELAETEGYFRDALRLAGAGTPRSEHRVL